jgi:uncharacterized lipoprotein
MNENEISSLAESWIAYWKAAENSVERETLSDVSDIEWELVRKQPKEAWQLVLRVLQLDRSAEIQQVLSAGPLEDLLSHHGDTMIPLVEAEARKNPVFAKLLGGVWKNAMSDEVWERVRAVWDRKGWDGMAE